MPLMIFKKIKNEGCHKAWLLQWWRAEIVGIQE
jgi:hypothetical protein